MYYYLTQALYAANIVMTLLTYEWMEGIGVDPDQEQSDWVHTVCFTYISHICSRRHKHMTFSGEFFKVFQRLNLQKEVGCNRSASLCKLIDKVVQLNEWEF